MGRLSLAINISKGRLSLQPPAQPIGHSNRVVSIAFLKKVKAGQGKTLFTKKTGRNLFPCVENSRQVGNDSVARVCCHWEERFLPAFRF